MSVSLLPTRAHRSSTTQATVGLDLTGLGVNASSDGFSADLPVEKADLARLASYTRTAHQNGVSFVSLGEQFRLRSDRAVRRDSWLDPVVAARRISPHAGAAGLVTSVPASGADLSLVAGELAQITHTNGTWAGLQLAHHAGDTDALARTLTGVTRSLAATRGRAAKAPQPRVVVPVGTESEVELAGAHADVVRIRETDLEWARELRYAVRAASRAAGRENVRVLVDLHTVISADRDSAEARAELVSAIAGDAAPWQGALTAYGTATDVADLIQTWIQAGAADGFVVLPGSLPADVVGLLRGVLPELRSRGLVGEQTVADRPTVRRSAPTTARTSASTVSRPAAARRAGALADVTVA
ncbi:LLM class flavin-dependent oxidoreductase [Georgenia yuyongxinii]|uniref:LLM class flavin-dependent oxidoreductase n=1 Tax=Georgenia yuyongxinii TaxID=2589797 RepID=A0A552WU50_9MICO|nr:LLM class flavin-dependent oxidoreductase [Georgenia yuyongxinii]TRW46294.1 LLM class flavin-dependent oxidoreductase [Georgenia yuyongxinii]